MDEELKCYPLTPDRWHDFELLFGPRGAYGGCWCMWWRLSRKQFEQQQGAANKQAMKALVDTGTVPGILGYYADSVAAWCSVARREDFPSLNRSRILKPIDNLPVWSIVCFYVAKSFRGQGTLLQLICSAVDYVRKRGGKIVEAYPTVPRGKQLPPVSSFMGIPIVLEKAGFRICARPSEAKMIMRYNIQ
jgi:hypothetical protein